MGRKNIKMIDRSSFTRQALAEGVRLDKRNREDFREVIHHVERFGQVDVRLGNTRTSAQVVAPRADRPNEGFISFNVDFGAMADENVRGSHAQLLRRRIEKLLRGSQSIDNEALCIVAGQKVWSLSVDIRVVVNDGNVGDAASIAALGSLLSFRKPDIEFNGTSIQVFTEEAREPLPLPIHHLPFPTTFAIVDGRWLADPTFEEEAVSTGQIFIGADKHGDICCLHAAGQYVQADEILGLYTPVAMRRAKELHEILQNSLSAFEEDRAKRRRNRTFDNFVETTRVH